MLNKISASNSLFQKMKKMFYLIVRRRTRVWALAPKPESVDACFLLFLSWGGVSCSEVRPQKIPFCFLSLIRCLVKFVVLESHSQSLWVLNQCHITINTHLLSHIATFCLSLYFFAQTKFVSLLLLLSFFWLATIQLEAFF